MGTDPTYALIDLKLRMDMWRDPSCDNAAAIQEYARQQVYGEPTELQLSSKAQLRGPFPSQADFKLASIAEPNSFKSSMSTAVRLGQSLGKRANAILKRKSEGADTREKVHFEDEPVQLESGSPQLYTEDLMLMSGALSNELKPERFTRIHSSMQDSGRLGSAYYIATNIRDRSNPSLLTDISSSTNTSLSTTTPDTIPDLPELDGAPQPGWLQDNGKGKGKGKERESSYATYNSFYHSPTSTEPPRAYNTVPSRHSFSGDRRRPQSRSGPPSPIMEEVVIPRKSNATGSMQGANNAPRRYSLDAGMSHTRPGPRPSNGTTSTRVTRHPSYSSDNLPHSRLSLDMAHYPHKVCATCRRCKKPVSPVTPTEFKPITAGLPQPVSESKTSRARGNALTRRETDPAQWLAGNISNEQEEDQSGQTGSEQEQGQSREKGTESEQGEEELQHIPRFPSLHGLRLLSSFTTTKPESKPESQPEATTDRSKPRRQRSNSQPASLRSSDMTEIAPPFDTNAPRKFKGTPLYEQCYTPSIRSSTSTRRRMSLDTIIASPSKPPQPLSLTNGDGDGDGNGDEYTLDVELPERKVEPKQAAPEPELESGPKPEPAPESEQSESEREEPKQVVAEESTPERAPSPEPIISIERAMSPSQVTQPEPNEFPVMMRSNGSKQSLAVILQDEKTSMVVPDSIPPSQEKAYFSQFTDNPIVLDRLIEGFQFIKNSPIAAEPRCCPKPLGKKVSHVTTTTPPTHSKQKSMSSVPSSGGGDGTKSRPRSWTGNLRLWKSKDVNVEDTLDSRLPAIGKDGQLQIRVLTMDSTGKFVTQVVDSPVETTLFDFGRG